MLISRILDAEGILHTFLNLGAAFILGGIIGFERQWRQRLAGLRTNTLVAIGAASFVTFAGLVQGDSSPTRIAAQVVSGIGFLGAGIIFKDGVNVSGLNTAATLWCSAAVGILCGAGFYPHAAVVTFFVVGTNLFLRPLVKWIGRRPDFAAEADMDYVISIVCHAEMEARVRILLVNGFGQSMHMVELESSNIEDSNRVEVIATLRSDDRQDLMVEHIVGRLSLEPLITAASWRLAEVKNL